MNIIRILLALFLCAAFTACSKKEPMQAAAPRPHVHQPPHGGTVVVLGKEAFHLELVRDAAAGTLTAHVLDGHLENIVRLEDPAITLVATVDGTPQTLVLTAVANPLSNETVGDSSVFAGQADWLKTTAVFDAVIPIVTVRTVRFEQVAFNFPAGNDHD